MLCLNNLLECDGTATGTTDQLYWDAFKASYTNNVGTTSNFTNPLNGSVIAAHFDSYKKMIWDLLSQIIDIATGRNAGASYEMKIVRMKA